MALHHSIWLQSMVTLKLYGAFVEQVVTLMPSLKYVSSTSTICTTNWFVYISYYSMVTLLMKYLLVLGMTLLLLFCFILDRCVCVCVYGCVCMHMCVCVLLCAWQCARPLLLWGLKRFCSEKFSKIVICANWCNSVENWNLGCNSTFWEMG